MGSWSKPSADSLVRAAHSGDSSAVRALLQQGADINGRGARDWTALIAASNKGHGQVVHDLLERGVNVDLRTIDGETALMRACRF